MIAPVPIIAWAHAHRRAVLSAILILVVALAALEIGARVVTPDTLEVIEYTGNSSDVMYDHIITRPSEVIATYHSMTRTTAEWATYENGYGFVTCQQGTLSYRSNTRSNRLVLRFLWHGIPVSVATHYPLADNPYPFWHCQDNLTEWQVTAGGFANPRPYVNDTVLTLFPWMTPTGQGLAPARTSSAQDAATGAAMCCEGSREAR